MTITRVGSTSKYADGWETAFGKSKRTKKTASAKKPVAKAKAATKKTSKGATAKKKAKRK